MPIAINSRRFLTMPGFNGVAAGQTASVDLPTNLRYAQIRLQFGTVTAGGPTRANMEAEIPEVRIKVDGKVQRVFSAAQLFSINLYHGVPVTDGILPIFFAEPWRREALGEDLLAWGTGDVGTLQIEADLVGGANSLKATAIIIPGNAAMGRVVKWRRFVVPVSAIGVVNVTTLPRQDPYYALHAVSGNVNNVEVKIDGRDWFDNIAPADLNEYLAQAGFVPQAGHFHIDFAATGRVADALPLVDNETGQRAQDFRIDFDMAVAANFDLITEVLGLRD